MKIVTETENLILREFILDDSRHFFSMNNDPEVIKYTGDSAFASMEEAGDFLDKYEEYRKYGIGRWAVIRKEDHEFLGWCGLRYHPDEGVTELGYRFYRKFWGNGYGSESALAALTYGFQEMKLPRIYAHVHVDNLVSRRILEGLGMTFVKDFDYDGIPAALFQIENPAYVTGSYNADEVRTVRHPVLRKGMPYESCFFPEDFDATTVHVGSAFNGRMAGAVTMVKNHNKVFPEAGQYQLRGMAVLDDFQRKGVGQEMVIYAEKEVRNRGCGLIWLNAREKAVSFYRRLGYEIVGERFEVPVFGPHFLMVKKDF
ncbi:GNAT family N-acetyltransferase [Robertkochia solimangrovi]|uniref:GNAT family N-acetyltransferase n=1 Tax=Robertkochia solimangrovi TaxID=2213046 RepID=UPI00117D9443|nr:GNAT family N-acetyltransferase [Robertkochia solimangrovi]TRZ41415.1 hypothetical protein DMZ48_17170 [Robertkochia solimangrovi]